ncbi:RipA family octameric membrane protein [Capnocytophaga cynodegmi]|uniref:RipA family octameric membrane protein n=2 Tax=Capnocytophaga cynodegmi TaxID=28189 RepID=UPI00385E858F
MKKEEKYKILIDARNFHYDNFNKWMTYFYVMIGAIFVAFYDMLKQKDYLNSHKIEIIGICVAGFIVSLFWYWANKGYYYWNINFITLVNHYEKNILKFKKKKRIYFVFANKNNQNNYLNPLKGANISTSKISILLSFIVTLFWSTFLFNILSLNIITNLCCRLLISFGVGISSILLISKIVGKKILYSYHSHFPDLEIETESKNDFKPKKRIST